MAKKSKKQRRAKKKKDIHKRHKAKKLALPRLLRKEPLLNEALDYRHPLVSCLINEGWDEGRTANILIIREAPVGLPLCLSSGSGRVRSQGYLGKLRP